MRLHKKEHARTAFDLDSHLLRHHHFDLAITGSSSSSSLLTPQHKHLVLSCHSLRTRLAKMETLLRRHGDGDDDSMASMSGMSMGGESQCKISVRS